MNEDPIDVLEALLTKHDGRPVDIRNNEVDSYFLFDRLDDKGDLDRAWSLFPCHEEIRRRAQEVDDACDSYRVPRPTNRCSDDALLGYVRGYLDSASSLIDEEDSELDIHAFLRKPHDVRLWTPDDGPRVSLGEGEYGPLDELDERLGDIFGDAYPSTSKLHQVLHHWAVYLTKYNEVAHYLLWPLVKDIIPLFDARHAFDLWRVRCLDGYWIKDQDLASGVVLVKPPWLADGA